MGAREVSPGQLFDLAHPVAQRVAVAVDLARGALPLAVLLDEGFQRAQQLAAVLLVALLDRAEDAVAVELQRLVVLDREQQGEGAEIAPGGNLRGVAVVERGRLQGAARFVEGAAQVLARRGAAGRGAHGAVAGAQRTARRGGDVDRVAIGGVDDGAEQLAPADDMRGDDGRAGVGRQNPLESVLGGGGVVEGEDEDGGLVFADPERLEAAAQLGRLHPPAEGAGEHVAGEAALGLAGDPAAHQLQRHDRDRLLEDQPLEVAKPAGIAHDHDPRLRRATARRDHRVGEGAPGDRGVGRDEGVAVGGMGKGFLADRGDRLGGELAAETAARDALAAAVEDRHGAADGGGDRGGDLLQPALLQNQPLEPPLHRDAPLQHLVLLVDKTGEGLLGDRDERGRVGNLEEREVALASPRPAAPSAACGG